MYTPDQALAFIGDLTPVGTRLMTRGHIEHRTPQKDEQEDGEKPEFFSWEYRPRRRFAPNELNPLQLEIYSPKGVTLCVYEVIPPRSEPVSPSVIEILMITMVGSNHPALMFVNIEQDAVGRPSHALFLVQIDPNMYFQDVDPIDQMPGSTTDIPVVDLTLNGIGGFRIANIAQNIFVSRLDGEHNTA